MSFITPNGGWDDSRLQQTQPVPIHPNQPVQYLYASPPQAAYYSSSYLICKVCDRGTLTPRKVFRMSGPAVAIGFILLIPSIVGMLVCAAFFLGFLSHVGSESVAVETVPVQSAFDASFRKSCARSFRSAYQEQTGTPATLLMTEEACECALAGIKRTGDVSSATSACSADAVLGSLEPPAENVDALYSGRTTRTVPPTHLPSLIRLLGSGAAVAMGVGCFVGGLLGWLLVMRKRVLQCGLCGAVVNAS